MYSLTFCSHEDPGGDIGALASRPVLSRNSKDCFQDASKQGQTLHYHTAGTRCSRRLAAFLVSPWMFCASIPESQRHIIPVVE